MRLDPDGRLRTIYSPGGTVTGRLNSTQTPWKTGWNSQNAPPWFREAIIPDPGYVFGSVDLKQAEAVLVAYFAQEPEMIKCFEAKEDIHRFNAANIYGVPPEKVTKDQRYIAKRLVHAFDYLLGDDHAASIAQVSIFEARRIKGLYFRRFPRILEWHEEIREQLKANRTLVNPFGRRRLFLDRLGDELLRKAVAYLPQSTCVDTTNEALLRMADVSTLREDGIVRLRGIDGQLLLQVHDEVLFQFVLADLDAVRTLIQSAYEIPITIHGRTFQIETEFKISKESWGKMTNEGSF